MKDRAEHCLQCIQQFFISYVCLSAKPIDNMLRYVNGDKQYQFHDLTVDVEPGHIYSKTSQLRFRTWTNKGKIIRLDSFITTTVITIRERYRLLLHCSVIQGTINNAMHYYTIHLNAMLYHSRQCNTIQCDTTHVNAIISTGNSMICSDILKLLYMISRAVRRVKFETILKYHEWYLCQVSRANHAIICLYYPQKVCNFHM